MIEGEDMSRKRNQRKIPLFAQLAMSHIAIIVVMATVLITGRYIMSQQFGEYSSSRLESTFDALEETIEYALLENKESMHVLNGFRTTAFGPTYSLKVYDANGIEVYDLSHLDSKEFNTVHVKVKGGKLVTESRELHEEVNGEEVYLGYFELKYTSFNDLTAEDAEQLEVFEELYVFMILLVVSVGGLFSFVISRSITKPIRQVIETTEDIRHGDLEASVKVRTYTKEIIELEDAINYMVKSLKEEDELRSQMTSDMAHEIRTPVNNIQNILEAMIDGVWERDDETLEKCYQEVIRLGSLVSELKNIANIEQDNLVTDDVVFDAVSKIQDIMDLFSAAADKKSLAMSLESPEIVKVNMDENKFSQIVSNLISNSIRYTHDGGTISIKIISHGNNLLVSVRDDGIGIPKEHLNRVFERFYRTDESRNNATGGLGLGLTITKKIIESYGGTVTVDSEVEQFTEVCVELPVLD